MQIKTTTRFHLVLIKRATVRNQTKPKETQKISVGEEVEKLKPLCIVYGNANNAASMDEFSKT
jgi:hypothetical protein